MLRRRTLFTSLLITHLLLWSIVGTATAQTAQDPAGNDLQQGIALYKSGNIAEAVAVLHKAVKNNESDFEAWYFLGLALLKKPDLNESSKSFENAIKIKPDFALAHVGLSYAFLLRNRLLDAQVEAQDALRYDQTNADAHYIIGLARLRAGARKDALEHAKMAIELNPEMGDAYLLKSQCLVGFTATPSDESSPERRAAGKARYEEAATALEKYLQLTPSGVDNPLWAEQVENLRFYANLLGDELKDKQVFTGKEVTTKARVLTKPEPSYPLAARENRVSGAVILRGVFAADGTVQHLLVLQGLPHGLTQECLKAARQIKFAPASIDGRDVSTFIQLEYNFSSY